MPGFFYPLDLFRKSSGLQISGRSFAFFCDHVIADLLAFVQAAQACCFYCADVNEHIISAAVRLDETKTLLRVEPFNCTLSHIGLL